MKGLPIPAIASLTLPVEEFNFDGMKTTQDLSSNSCASPRIKFSLAVPSLLLLAAALLPGTAPLAAAVAPVTVREENVVIPTYEADTPEPNPMFYFGRLSQGAQAPVYPYPIYDLLTNKKVDKTYKILWLGNEDIRIGILPEIGGRILEA